MWPIQHANGLQYLNNIFNKILVNFDEFWVVSNGGGNDVVFQSGLDQPLENILV